MNTPTNPFDHKTKILLNHVVTTLKASMHSTTDRLVGFSALQSIFSKKLPITSKEYGILEKELKAFLEDADTFMANVSKIQSSYQRLKELIMSNPKPQNDEKPKQVQQKFYSKKAS